MPDWEGKLLPDEATRLQDWFRTRWRNPVCPVSNERNWVTGERLVQSPIYKGNSYETLTQGDITYVYVVLICAGCGYTVFVNATVAGILPPKGGSNG
jgi:hypothetical protein